MTPHWAAEGWWYFTGRKIEYTSTWNSTDTHGYSTEIRVSGRGIRHVSVTGHLLETCKWHYPLRFRWNLKKLNGNPMETHVSVKNPARNSCAFRVAMRFRYKSFQKVSVAFTFFAASWAQDNIIVNFVFYFSQVSLHHTQLTFAAECFHPRAMDNWYPSIFYWCSEPVIIASASMAAAISS